MFQTDLAENICNAVSDRRSRCQRKIDDAKRNTKSSGRFLCNQLAYSRNLERRFFDRLAQYFKTLTAYLLQGSLYNARANTKGTLQKRQTGYIISLETTEQPQSAVMEKMIV